MRIATDSSLIIARHVISELQKIVNHKIKSRAVDGSVIKSFDNCREQGLSVVQYLTDKRVSVAECRNSDQIVVWVHDNVHNLDHAKATYFDHGNYKDAAHFMCEQLYGKDK